MAILTSTGFYGFICSAARKAGEYAGTFVSGVSGWVIKINGDAEFKSIYARDKIVTNEYVYNRIRVTEDEEVVTSNGKILSSTDNEDGTYTVYLDLREGDINPFAEGDLLQGYYHSPGNTGTTYAVQNITVQADPNTEDQHMIVTCEEGSVPYQHMVIVRVGNTINAERQAFIKISSRTNCQYFFDAIASFADISNPEKVKCVFGRADIGLIPAWAVSAIGTVKRWFGLIADGVILRGTFILKSSGKTVETELEGVTDVIKEVETRFEVREGQISSKVTETKTYAENASTSAESAASSADSASNSATASSNSAAASEAAKVIAVEKSSEAVQTVNGFTQTVTEKTEIVVNAANNASSSATSASGSATAAAGSASAAADSAAASESAKNISIEKASEAKQTAEGFTQTVTEITKQAVTDAVAGADTVIEEKVSTQVSQSAKNWKIEVMGPDAEGNPNTILSAINADESGVKIKGDKVQITGTLLAQIIMAQGLNVNENFIVYEDGRVDMTGGFKLESSDYYLIMNKNEGGLVIKDKAGKIHLRLGFGSITPDQYKGGCIEFFSYNTEGNFIGRTHISGRGIYDSKKQSGYPDDADYHISVGSIKLRTSAFNFGDKESVYIDSNGFLKVRQ